MIQRATTVNINLQKHSYKPHNCKSNFSRSCYQKMAKKQNNNKTDNSLHRPQQQHHHIMDGPCVCASVCVSVCHPVWFLLCCMVVSHGPRSQLLTPRVLGTWPPPSPHVPPWCSLQGSELPGNCPAHGGDATSHHNKRTPVWLSASHTETTDYLAAPNTHTHFHKVLYELLSLQVRLGTAAAGRMTFTSTNTIKPPKTMFGELNNNNTTATVPKAPSITQENTTEVCILQQSCSYPNYGNKLKEDGWQLCHWELLIGNRTAFGLWKVLPHYCSWHAICLRIRNIISITSKHRTHKKYFRLWPI